MLSICDVRRVMRRLVRCLWLAGLLACGIRPAHADLFVSNLFDGNVNKFDNQGRLLVQSFVNPGEGGEGVAVLNNELYVASFPSGVIRVYDAITSRYKRDFVSLAGASFAAMHISPDHKVMYVADESVNSRLLALRISDGAILDSVPTPYSHDVRVLPDGNGVLATSFNVGGVYKFAMDLTPVGLLIEDNDNGLGRAGGMTFDRNGNLWVSNFEADPVDSGVFEYTASGQFITKVLNNAGNELLTPLGLDLGPDGNIYAAVLGHNSVARIDLAHGNALSTFIANEGDVPKYLVFTVPEPSSDALMVLAGLGMVVAWRRMGRG